MTDDPIMQSGMHAGERFQRIPVSYLKWMVNVGHAQAADAQTELERRGTVTPDLDLSGHAIDRASLKCLKIWERDRGPNEGLHAWLIRVTGEAIKNGHPRGDRIHWKGMQFAIETSGKWPVLKTIMPDNSAGGQK